MMNKLYSFEGTNIFSLNKIKLKDILSAYSIKIRLEFVRNFKKKTQ